MTQILNVYKGLIFKSGQQNKIFMRNNHKCCVIANEYRDYCHIENMIKDNPRLGLDCQFSNQDTYEHNGQYFCKFHLPLSSKLKAKMNLQNEIIELLNHNHRNFDFISVQNVNFNCNNYQGDLIIHFRGAILSNTTILNIKNYKVLNIQHTVVKGNFNLTNLKCLDIRIDQSFFEMFPFDDNGSIRLEGFLKGVFLQKCSC